MSETQTPETTLQAQGMPVTVHAQYVRDISFENPHAPDSLRTSNAAPEMNIQIGMDVRKLESDESERLYEVVLNVTAEAKRGEDVAFIAEVLYGTTVEVGESVPEDKHHPLLLIEIPKLSFPYVRQILSDLTTSGGYPPLLLTPVDFHALYMQRFAQDTAALEKLDAEKKAS